MHRAKSQEDVVGAEPSRPVLALRPRTTHAVKCGGCTSRFDLFAAEWCTCAGRRRSKICPGCRACACTRPGFLDPRLWGRAPPAFQQHGFEALFVEYI